MTRSALLARCRDQLGAASVLADAEAIGRRYGGDTSGQSSRIAAAVLVRSRSEVVFVLAEAHAHDIPVHPVSTGRNWGYGGAHPVAADAVLLDLAGLDGIDDSALDLGLITLEPGVTQAQLARFLADGGHEYLVPVHGGGPGTSLVGNALERGFGITPHTDHFGAVMAVEAILPDGRLYRGALTEQGCGLADQCFKWGVGPYLDGLFAQSGMGVVVAMTIALAARPARTRAFVFRLHSDADLEPAVAAIGDVLTRLGGVTGSLNLMNSSRVLAMTARTQEATSDTGALNEAAVARLLKAHRIAPWTGFGALYGETPVVRAAERVLRARLRGVCRGLRVIGPGGVERLAGAADLLPASVAGRAQQYLNTVRRSLGIVDGFPSEMALALAYWGRSDMPTHDRHPARDGCGIIWYSPIVPMRAAMVRAATSLIERVCRDYGLPPLMTLTSLSPRCFDATVPLLFDARDTAASENARHCYATLVREGRAIGIAPYRYPPEAMPSLVDPAQPFWWVTNACRDAVGARGLIAPGRYASPPP